MDKYIKLLKQERDYLLGQEYIARTQESKLLQYLDSDLIKVITGPRRAGKSTLGIKSLVNYPDFFYINFDNAEILSIEDKFKFIVDASAEFKNGKTLFLDEIQNVEGFELLVSQLQRNGFNVVMTGSNANLLSKELATHLTGRYIRIEVLPFSYAEAKLMVPELSYLDYMRMGGFPEQLKMKGQSQEYIQTLFESILLKDIVSRYSVRNTADLLKLAQYFVKTPSQASTYNKIANKLDIKSVNTVVDYYDYLGEAYLVFKLGSYSSKASEIVKSDFKTYLVDTGVFAAHSVKFGENMGYLFENSVFLELIRNGYVAGRDLYKYKNEGGSEVDFLIDGEDRVLIQATLSLLDNTTREREFAALRNLSSNPNTKKIVVVLDAAESGLSTFDDSGKVEIEVVGVEALSQVLIKNS